MSNRERKISGILDMSSVCIPTRTKCSRRTAPLINPSPACFKKLDSKFQYFLQLIGKRIHSIYMFITIAKR